MIARLYEEKTSFIRLPPPFSFRLLFFLSPFSISISNLQFLLSPISNLPFFLSPISNFSFLQSPISNFSFLPSPISNLQSPIFPNDYFETVSTFNKQCQKTTSNEAILYNNRINIPVFPAVTVVIQTITDDKIIGDGEPHVIQVHIFLKRFGFEK